MWSGAFQVFETLPHATARSRSAAPAIAFIMSLTITGCGQEPSMPGGRVLLHPGGDVLATGQVVDLDESADGDAMAAGRTVRFNGDVGGSFLGAAADEEIRGRVDGSIRAAGGTVRILASVGRNVTAAGATVELVEGAEVQGNAYLAGGSVHVTGIVHGDLYAGGREIVLDGPIGGDVRIEAETLSLGPNARIDGELRFRLSESGVVRIATDAVIARGVNELPPREGGGGGLAFGVLRLLGFLLAGAVLVALAPRSTTAAAEPFRERPGATFGYGVLVAIGGPLVVLVLAATAVGIPLALLVAALYAIASYLAPVLPSIWLGEEILDHRPSARGGPVLIFAVGGSLVGVASMLPWIGFPVRAIATCLGLGSLAMRVRDIRTWAKRVGA